MHVGFGHGTTTITMGGATDSTGSVGPASDL